MAKVILSDKQKRYLMAKTNIQELQEAVTWFAEIMISLGIDTRKIGAYVDRMMKDDGFK